MKSVNVPTPTDQEIEALAVELDKCNLAAQGVLLEMNNSLRLLREAKLEASTAREIIARSNRNEYAVSVL